MDRTLKAKKISRHVVRGQPTWLEALAAFEHDLFAHGRSQATIRTYASAVRTFGAFYRDELKKPGPYTSRLHAADLHAFIDHLRRERQLSAASVNRFVAALHSFVRCGLAHKWLRSDIARELRTYEVAPAREPITLRPVEVRRLLAAPDAHRRNGLRDQAMLNLFVHTGIRLSELTALSVGDVTLHKTTGELLVRGDKSRRDRRLHLNADVRTALQSYLKSRGEPAGDEPLLLSERSGRLSNSSVHHLVKKYLSFAGRKELSAHALRHHFAAKLYGRTGKLTAVKRALGHRSIVTTARYAQTSAEELAAAIESLASAETQD
jgi:site-specific recombinase XerD